jgi:hypothetical protein
VVGRASWGRMVCERSDDGGAGGGGPRLWKIICSAARLCWSKLHRQKRYYDDRTRSEGELRARQEVSRWTAKEKQSGRSSDTMDEENVTAGQGWTG